MKSLPEKDFWNAVRNRLENYKEEPQDDWLKIAGAIPASAAGKENKPVNLAADLLSVTSVIVLVWTLYAVTPVARIETLAHVSTSQAAEQMDGHQADSLKEKNERTPKENEAEQSEKALHSMANEAENEGFGSVGVHEKAQWTKVSRQRVPLPAQHNDIKVDGGEYHFTHVDGRDGEFNAAGDSVQAVVAAKTDTLFFAVPPILQQTSKPRRKFRPSVYAVITPSFAYQKIVPKRDDNINIQRLNSAGLVSGDRLGYSLEAGFQMQVSNQVELYAGFSYYQQNLLVSYSYVTDGEVQSVNGTGEKWSYELSPGQATRTFRYAMKNGGAAAGVLYHIRGRKLMHKLGAGLQYQKGLVSAPGEHSYNNALSSYLSYQLMYRMEYSLGGRTSVFLQPQFVHSLVADEALREPFAIKPYRTGLGFGLLYHFHYR